MMKTKKEAMENSKKSLTFKQARIHEGDSNKTGWKSTHWTTGSKTEQKSSSKYPDSFCEMLGNLVVELLPHRSRLMAMCSPVL